MKEIGHNKRAHYDYIISEELEAGIVLVGTEVKSMRSSRVNLSDSYAGIDHNSDVYIYNMHVPPYPMAYIKNHEPKRSRRLLLHKRQINKLVGVIKKGGYTLIPISIYFNNRGLIKMKLGVAKGKKMVDKRETIKQREWDREKRRILKTG